MAATRGLGEGVSLGTKQSPQGVEEGARLVLSLGFGQVMIWAAAAFVANSCERGSFCESGFLT